MNLLSFQVNMTVRSDNLWITYRVYWATLIKVKRNIATAVATCPRSGEIGGAPRGWIAFAKRIKTKVSLAGIHPQRGAGEPSVTKATNWKDLTPRPQRQS